MLKEVFNIVSEVAIKLVLLITLALTPMLGVAADDGAMWRYTVRPGDNLITLGKTHLINPDDWKVVQRLNHIKNPYRMHAGQNLRVPLDLVKQLPAEAEVTFVSGQAELQKDAKHFETLKVGQKLTAGANIVTKEKSKVVIKFADGTTTELASNSNLKLDTLSLYSGGAMVDTKLRLQKGQLETQANPNHIKGNTIEVITPTAIAAVRGTKFRVSADGKATTQETLDGRVALAAQGNQIAVNKGFGSKAEQGKPPIPPVVLLPAADVTSLKKQYQALPVTFDMPSMQGAAAWSGKVATDATLDQLVAEADTQSQQLAFADVPDGQYYLSLRAKDENNIAGYDALHQFTLNARPFQPAFVSPAANDVVRDAQPVLAWEPEAKAQVYALEVAKDEAFNQMHETKQLEATRYQLDKPLTAGSYYWRISSIAINEHGVEDRGPALKSRQFIYKPMPPKPDISQLNIKVANNTVFVTTAPPVEGMTYKVNLDNKFNNQNSVWQADGVGGEFSFPLREYGEQTLSIQHIDQEGVAGPAAVYEFDAQP